MTTEQQNAIDQNTTEIEAQATVIIKLDFGKIGLTRKGNTREISTSSDKNRISLTKKLFDCPEIEAINTLDTLTRTYILNRAFDGVIGKGMYLLPTTLIYDVQEQLISSAKRRKELVQNFVQVYENEKQKARETLRDQYRETDYPANPADEFYMSWKYIKLATPENLPPELLAIEKEKTRAEWEKVSSEVRDALRYTFSELVEHLTDRLTPDIDGKKKIFKDTTVTNLEEFMNLFDKRNLTNDKELAALIAKARQVIATASPEKIRTSNMTRSTVARNMAEVKEAISKLISTKTSRKFDLE